ncbi:hypothetical protein Tco_1501508, partial [Tanacetum coccineum]
SSSRSSVPIGLLALAIDAACAFRAEEMPSLISCRMAAKVMAGVSDVDVLLGGILLTQDNTSDNDAIGGNDDERTIIDDILKILLIGLVTSLDFLNDLFKIGNSIDELDNVVEEEDGEWIRFLGGNSFSRIKKYRGSNSSDGGNTRDGVKIASGVIGSGDEIEFSEELKELLPDEAGK